MLLTKEQAKDFGKRWTHKGVSIFMDDTHYQFAADFAVIVLKSFIENAQHQAAEAAKKKQIVIAEN